MTTPNPDAPITDASSAATRLAEMHERIAAAAKPARRDPSTVTLIAISKTHPAEAIAPLIDADQRHFGENRVQEAQGKWPELREAHDDLVLHMVGGLQSNKAADAVALFDVIHSLDRMSLVKALAKAMDAQDKRVPCFVQVDIGEEPQKGGVAMGELPDLLSAARDADIPLAGLMAVPPAGVHAGPYFALLAKLAQDNGLSAPADGLSMGMSGDFETAIALGASHIRVGTALFGKRGTLG